MFSILSSSFYSKSKCLNVHQNYPVTHCIFISLLYIWYVKKHGVPCFTSANTRRSVSFIESPKSFFVHIYCPTDAKMFRYGMERSFLFFFYLPKWLLTRLKKFTENALWKIRFLSGDFFFWQRKCLVEDTISEWWFFFGNKKTTFMLSVVKEWLWKPVISIRTQAV